MKRLNTLLFFFLVALTSQLQAGGFITSLKEGVTAEKLFTTAIDEKKNQLKLLKEERGKLVETAKEFSAAAKIDLAETAVQINKVKSQIKIEPQNEDFFNNELSILNERYQTTKDREQGYKQLMELIEEHIDLLEEYLKDPDQKEYAKEYRVATRPIYPFADLQAVDKMITAQKKQLEYLDEQEKNASSELDSRTRSASASAQAYESKRSELKAFADLPEAKTPEGMFGFDVPQKMMLLELQEKLAREKNELAKLQVRITECRVSLLKTKVFVAKLRLEILKDAFKLVKESVRVRTEDVSTARAQWNKRQQQVFAIKERYRQEVDALIKDNERRLEELKRLSTQHEVSLDAKIDEWDLEPRQTVASYLGLCSVGNLNSQYQLMERKKELLQAQMGLEDEKLRYERLQIEIKSSFQGIRSKRFSSEEDIAREIREYEAPLADINATISRFKEKENAATALLAAQKRARENVPVLLEDLQKKRTTIFRGYPKDLNRCLLLLRDAQARIQQQIGTIEKTIGLYHDIIAKCQDAKDQIAFIVGELRGVSGIWLRSEYAIKIEAFKKILPDVKRFFVGIRLYITEFTFSAFVQSVKDSFPGKMSFIWFALKMLLLLVFLFVFKRYFALGFYRLFARLQEYRGLKIISFLARAFLDFVLHYYGVISAWIVFFALLKFGLPLQRGVQSFEYGIHVLFYLASIPYFIYLANRFFHRLLVLNASNDYVFLTRQFQPRFSFIVSTLLYATIIIQLFRQAFVLAGYPKSEFPEILLALNFIILQVSLIFLITREQILSLISTEKEFGQWIYHQVDRFFYLILAFVIVAIILINPYVGLGRLVLHVVFRLILTVMILPVIFWGHTLLKKVSSKLFFATEDDMVKERFPSAKSWYGLSVIISFLGVILIGSVVGAWIWGWSVTFSSIFEWMRAKIFPGEGGVPISVLSFLRLLGFIIAGFLVSYAFIRFVLRKIFDLLLIEMGVQHAVISITRYLIIVTFIMIGLENVGLGPLTKWLFGILLAIGWIVKEPLGDLVAYFILLIQRPLKIGDYVQLDDETFGVVRKITPRSIVIRRKNSTTIVVPNSQVLAKPVVNWNYMSGFVAMDDILINISYKEDPDCVIEILQKAVDSHPNLLKSPKPIIRLESFGEYSFVFLVRPFVSSHYTLDMWDIASDVRRTIVHDLRANNIDLAVRVCFMIPTEEKSKAAEQLKLQQKSSQSNQGDK